ncbi:hypothetical protein [Nonomuraea sp. NPDC049758]|uniref:protein kinase domain-containing protein n=1 Tax=Nonomuraea sp. NPDC049758 TaxID=3154360 RepID=UPI0034120E10
MATAYIPGPTLHQAVADHGPLPMEPVAVLGAGLAEGLDAIHAQNVVHRDLKPANVILTADGPASSTSASPAPDPLTVPGPVVDYRSLPVSKASRAEACMGLSP